MPDWKTTGASARRIVTIAVCAALLAGCSDDPETMLRSAKEYLAKNETNAAVIQLKNALQKDGNLAEARFLLGRVNLEQGDVASAVKNLRRAAESGYPEAQVAPFLARALVLSGEFDRVITEFGGKSVDDPAGQAMLLGAVGAAHLGKAEIDKARAAYQAAIAADPSNASVRVGLAQAKLFGGDLDGALADADLAIAADPGLAEAHALRADVLIARNDIPGAVAALDAAVAAQPKAVNYRFALVSLLLGDKQIDAAASRLEAMKKIAPDHASTRYLQAAMDLRNNKLEDARDNVAEVVRLAPDYLPGRLLAGTIYMRLNQHVLAEENLKVVLARAPQNVLARRLLSASLLATAEPSAALATLQPLLDSPSADSATLSLAGRIFVAQGELDRAADYFAKVAAAEPDNAMARTRLGVSRLMGGDAERAVADLETAAGLKSDAGQADVALILTYLRRGDFDKAMAAQQQLATKQPNNPQTYTLRGGILIGKKDAAGARAAFEKALELNPDYVAAAVNLARLDIRDGRPEDARKRFDKIIFANPKNVEAYMLLANLLASTGAKQAEILSVLERAASANPGAVAPKLAVARYHLAGNDPRKALTILQDLAGGHPTDAQVLALLVRAQLAAGDQQQAISSLNTLAGIVPRSPGPLVELSDLQRLGKDRAGAERSLRRALDQKPDMLEAQQRLISMLVENGRTDDALAVSRTVQKQRPKAPAGLLFEGDVDAAAQKWPQAVQAYRKAFALAPAVSIAVKLHAAQISAGQAPDAAKTAADWLRNNPKDVAMRSYLAERALAEGRLDDARKLYETVNKLNPDNALVLNNMAWIAGQRHDPAALALAQRALALAPESAAILDTLGMLQVEGGKPDEGLANLRKAVSLSPDAGALRLNLAKAYLKSGRKDDALKELDHVVEQAPEGSELRAEATSLKQGL